MPVDVQKIGRTLLYRPVEFPILASPLLFPPLFYSALPVLSTRHLLSFYSLHPSPCRPLPLSYSSHSSSPSLLLLSSFFSLLLLRFPPLPVSSPLISSNTLQAAMC
eukprot:764028-Hanusia_phi.AAC.1